MSKYEVILTASRGDGMDAWDLRSGNAPLSSLTVRAGVADSATACCVVQVLDFTWCQGRQMLPSANPGKSGQS